MNNYDDIKRFIDKSKTEGLDYKEINEKSMGNGITSSMNKWTLISTLLAMRQRIKRLKSAISLTLGRPKG